MDQIRFQLEQLASNVPANKDLSKNLTMVMLPDA